MQARERERAELEAVLASGIFDRAPLLSRFLTYICEKYFAGEASEIKEYSIATEALNRPTEFDHTRDSIVRVEAHRLRKRLRQYYEGPGADHELRIEIPPGQYVPAFLPSKAERAEPAPAEKPQQPAETHRTRSIALLTLAALCIVALGITVWRVVDTQSDASGRTTAASVSGQAEVVLRISPGVPRGRVVEPTGRIWERDQFFLGGEAIQTTPPPELLGLPERLFASARYGRFEYSIPLDDGHYDLRLYFTDNGPSPAKGFDLLANGVPLLQNFDVASSAGGRGAVDVRVFAGLRPASDGYLRLNVEKRDGILHGLEVLRGQEHGMAPLRILAGQSAGHHDDQGQFWTGDSFYRGGRTTNRTRIVSNTSDPDLFLGERYGHFAYVLPAAAGRYTLRLSFAETWFVPDNPDGSGAGLRAFDVICNGRKLLEDFDIAQEAGGFDRAVIREFPGIEASSQGKVIVDFAPLRDNACINAIELIPEY